MRTPASDDRPTALPPPSAIRDHHLPYARQWAEHRAAVVTEAVEPPEPPRTVGFAGAIALLAAAIGGGLAAVALYLALTSSTFIPPAAARARSLAHNEPSPLEPHPTGIAAAAASESPVTRSPKAGTPATADSLAARARTGDRSEPPSHRSLDSKHDAVIARLSTGHAQRALGQLGSTPEPNYETVVQNRLEASRPPVEPSRNAARRRRRGVIDTAPLVEQAESMGDRVTRAIRPLFPELSSQAVARVVRGQQPRLEQCYTTAMRRLGRQETARVTLRLVISPTGDVSRVDVEGESFSGLDRCLRRTAAGWTFPESSDGAVVPIPLAFESRGG